MSTDEYTPTEAEVRQAYVDRWLTDQLTPPAEFDRFIARVRRDAKAEAWDEGAQAQADTYGGQIDTGPNPYRETGDSDEHR